MIELSAEQAGMLHGRVEEALRNGKAIRGEFGSSLLVDIKDEDGYAGHNANNRFFGMFNDAIQLVTSTDHFMWERRTQLVRRLNWATRLLETQVITEGVEWQDPEDSVPNFRGEPRGLVRLRVDVEEAKFGMPIGSMFTSEVPEFNVPELQVLVGSRV